MRKHMKTMDIVHVEPLSNRQEFNGEKDALVMMLGEGLGLSPSRGLNLQRLPIDVLRDLKEALGLKWPSSPRAREAINHLQAFVKFNKKGSN